MQNDKEISDENTRILNKNKEKAYRKKILLLQCPLADVGCHAILGFSAETGNYAILGIAGIRYITYRQAHPAPSPVLLFKFPRFLL